MTTIFDKSADVGSPKLAGSIAMTAGGFDITAAGADIWGTRDEFHYRYGNWEGDFDVTTRLESLTAADPYTKAGIMARESLDEGSRHVYHQVFPDNSDRNSNNGGYEYQYRRVTGWDMKAIYPPTSMGTPPFPVNYPDTWLRLTRMGDRFIGYWSKNGTDWDVYAEMEMPMPRELLLGLAVTSHNTEVQALAAFRSIKVL